MPRPDPDQPDDDEPTQEHDPLVEPTLPLEDYEPEPGG